MIWECWLWGSPDLGSFYQAGDDFAFPVQISKDDHNHNDGELWWIERAYAHIATRSSCLKCGSALDRPMHASAASGSFGNGALGYVIETRCGGWRRHRLVAMVTIDAGELVLGRLLNRGSTPLLGHDAGHTSRT